MKVIRTQTSNPNRIKKSLNRALLTIVEEAPGKRLLSLQEEAFWWLLLMNMEEDPLGALLLIEEFGAPVAKESI